MKKFIFLLIMMFSIVLVTYSQNEPYNNIRIEVKTDFQGEETTWEFRDINSGTVFYSGGPYENNSSNIYTHSLATGSGFCYAFSIWDSGGNGICGNFGNGYYKIYLNGTIVNEGCDFGSFAHVKIGDNCPSNDISIFSMSSLPYCEANSEYFISGVVKSNIPSLTSFDVSYKVNDGSFVESARVSCDIGLTETYEFIHPVPIVFSSEGIYNITIKITKPNGIENGEDIFAYENLVSHGSVPRKVLAEGFTTESCNICSMTIRGFISNNLKRSDVVSIQHFPSSPSYYHLSESRYISNNIANNFYLPGTMVDRAILDSEEGNMMIEPDMLASDPPYEVGLRLPVPAFVSVNIDGVLMPSSNELILDINGTIHKDLLEEDLRLSVCITEDSLPGTVGIDAVYNRVPRFFLSEYKGDAGIITNNTEGTTFQKAYTCTLDPSWNRDNLYVVAFVNNMHNSDFSQREVMNAEERSLRTFPSANTDIINFSFGNQNHSPAVINYQEKTIDIIVEYGSGLTNLIAQYTLFDNSTANISGIEQSSGVTENDFTESLIYTIVAPGNFTCDWTIRVTEAAPNSLANILSFSFGGFDYSPAEINTDTRTVNLAVLRDLDLTSLIAEFNLSEYAYSNIDQEEQISGITVNDYSEPLIYTVYAQNENISRDWTVNVKNYRSSEANILSFSFGEFDYNPAVINNSAKTIDILVVDEANTNSLCANFTLSEYSKAYVSEVEQTSGVSINDFSSPLYYTVRAEDGVSYEIWTIRVYQLPKSEADILSFSFGEFDLEDAIIDNENNTVKVNVKDNCSLSSLIAEFILSEGAKAYIQEFLQISGEVANDFRSEVIYKVIAEDENTEKDWTINVYGGKNNINVSDLYNVNIYPNPAVRLLNIDFVEGSDIKIIDVYGKEVFFISKAPTFNVINIDLNDGVYFVHVTKDNRNSIVKKFIVCKE